LAHDANNNECIYKTHSFHTIQVIRCVASNIVRVAIGGG